MKRTLFYLAGLAVLLPMALLALYALFSRWPWPDLLPSQLTLDALVSVFRGNALLVLTSSIGYSLLSALVATLVAAPGAMALAWYSFRGKRLVRALLLAPVLLPSTAYFVGLQAFFTRAGLGDTVLAVLLGHVIVILPYGVWTLTDVLGQMGKGLEEQARTLGASGPAALWHITLPQLLPALASVTGLGFVISFGQYFLTLMLGGGRVRTFAMLVVPYIQGGDRQLSAAYSLAFVAICAGVYCLFSRILQKHYREPVSMGKGAL